MTREEEKGKEELQGSTTWTTQMRGGREGKRAGEERRLVGEQEDGI